MRVRSFDRIAPGCLSRWLCQSALPPAVREAGCGSPPSAALGTVRTSEQTRLLCRAPTPPAPPVAGWGHCSFCANPQPAKDVV